MEPRLRVLVINSEEIPNNRSQIIGETLGLPGGLHLDLFMTPYTSEEFKAIAGHTILLADIASPIRWRRVESKSLFVPEWARGIVKYCYLIGDRAVLSGTEISCAAREISRDATKLFASMGAKSQSAVRMQSER